MLRSQELPHRWAEARPLLRPVLRPVTFVLGAPPSDAVLLARPFVPFLQEMVVIDAPDSMAYVTSATMADWVAAPPGELIANATASSRS